MSLSTVYWAFEFMLYSLSISSHKAVDKWNHGLIRPYNGFCVLYLCQWRSGHKDIRVVHLSWARIFVGSNPGPDPLHWTVSAKICHTEFRYSCVFSLFGWFSLYLYSLRLSPRLFCSVQPCYSGIVAKQNYGTKKSWTFKLFLGKFYSGAAHVDCACKSS